MTTTKDWEAEFDDKSSKGIFGGQFREEETDWPLVKAFIRSLLISQKNELRGVIVSQLEKITCQQCDDEALRDVLAALDV